MAIALILVSAALVSVFAAFAAVLVRANFQAEPARQRLANVTKKRRSF